MRVRLLKLIPYLFSAKSLIAQRREQIPAIYVHRFHLKFFEEFTLMRLNMTNSFQPTRAFNQNILQCFFLSREYILALETIQHR